MRPIGFILFVVLCIGSLIFFFDLRQARGTGGHASANLAFMTGLYLIFVVLVFGLYNLVLKPVDEHIVSRKSQG